MLSKEVVFIINKLKEMGFKGYIVGGAVRDYVLGKVPNDFDICTNALPNDILKIFHDCKTVKLGKEFGTIGVVINDNFYEITTFRSESNYVDHRRPSNVEFVKDLYVDLSRRDFTINALAYDGNIYDYFNGINDIKKGIIRTVGNPKDRFEEDGLRILRCFRFSSALGFEIEKETEKAALELFDYIFFSSWQRRSIELKKLINGPNYKNVLTKYGYLFVKLLSIFEYNNYYDYITDSQNLFMRLLLMYYRHQEILDEDLSLLELKKSDIDFIKEIYRCSKYFNFSNESNIRKKITLFIKNIARVEEILNYSLELKLVYFEITKEQYDVYKKNISIALSRPYTVNHINIKGIDLIKLGFSKNDIKGILNEVLYKIINGNLENEREFIINYIKDNF